MESIRKGWENADAEKFEKMWKLHVEIAEAIETETREKSMLPYRRIMILFISKMMVKKVWAEKKELGLLERTWLLLFCQTLASIAITVETCKACFPWLRE